MITTFKIFENKSIPQIGDYIVCKLPSNGYIEILDNLLRRIIGKIVDVQEPFDFYKNYKVAYDEYDIPDDLLIYFEPLKTYGTKDFKYEMNTRSTHLDLILLWAHTKKDLEIQLKGQVFDL